MKKLLLLITLLFLLGSCEHFRYAAYPITYPKVLRYDHRGCYKGYSQKTPDGRVRHYDSKNKYKGTSRW